MSAVGVGRGLALGVAQLFVVAILAGASPAEAYTVKQTEAGATVRWFASTVTLRIDPSMQRYFAGVPVQDVVTHAAKAWVLPGVPELLIGAGEPGPKGFTQGSGASNGVYLIEDWTLAESSLAVTVATFETKTGKIVDTDILVNAKHPFALLAAGPDAPSDNFDLRGVLTHEMGHVLGLGESYDVRMATMWPNVARGETHQRDLDKDDETGAKLAYEQVIESPAEATAAQEGCGGASVVVRRRSLSPALWIVVGVGLLGSGLWLRARTRKGGKKGGPLFALVLLFGAPFGAEPKPLDESAERVQVLRTLALRRATLSARRAGLSEAMRSESPEVRVAAAAVLERGGTREELSLASELALDQDDEVRRVASLAVERLRSAPPAARLRADVPEARARLGALLDKSTDVIEGEAVRAGVDVKQGLLWSRYLVHGEDRVVEVQIPGGTLGELTQVVSEQEAPSDGSTIVVAERANGRHAWAHLRDGVVYGGSLGDEGPAIEWAP